jgi:low affinity Fe/Cu permease
MPVETASIIGPMPAIVRPVIAMVIWSMVPTPPPVDRTVVMVAVNRSMVTVTIVVAIRNIGNRVLARGNTLIDGHGA